MPVHVAFTPDRAAPAAVGVVVDVLRATSTIAQALASGYRRVLCCSELDDARALRREILGLARRRRAQRRAGPAAEIMLS
jgi:phosphosulfolactate phosphohydrolase-like enzyme